MGWRNQVEDPFTLITSENVLMLQTFHRKKSSAYNSKYIRQMIYYDFRGKNYTFDFNQSRKYKYHCIPV